MNSAQEDKHLLQVASTNLDKGNYPAAENILHQLVLSSQTNPEAFYLLANLYYRQGKIKRSIKTFRRALDINADYTEARVGLAMVLNDTGRYDEAKKVFNGHHSFTNLKKTSAKKTNTPFAENPLGSEGDFESKLSKKYSELGEIYFKYRRYNEAQEQFQKASEFATQGDRGLLQMRVADCLVEKGALDFALSVLKKIVQENQQLLEARITLGKILYKVNRTMEAVEHWEKVLLKDPHHSEALHLIRQAHERGTTTLT